MRPALCVCYLIAVSQAVSAQSDIESFVDSLIGHQLETRRIAGAVVTVVDDGAVVFSKGYGDADVAARRPMSHDTLVRIASVAKTFTALAVMQLVESGKLDLDRDVNDYLDFTAPPLPGHSPLTLRRLLSHQSGFEDRPGDIGAWHGGRLTLDAMMAGQTTVPGGIVGLGLFSPLGAGGNAFIGHDGGTGGFQSTLALLPQERFGIFASYNSEGIQERVSAASELLARVAERYFAGTGLHPRDSPVGEVAGVYQFTRRVESNLFRIRSLVEQVAVRSENGRLTIRLAMLPFGESLDEIGSGLFRWTGRDVSFVGSGASARMQVGSSVGQFLRVPWWANAGIVVPIVFICGIVAAGSVLAWPVSFLRRRSVDSDALARRLWTATRLALFLDLIAIGAALWLVFGARPLVAFSSPIIAPLGLGHLRDGLGRCPAHARDGLACGAIREARARRQMGLHG